MPTSRPNVVLFVSDRQHADTIHAGGTAGIATPHLDRLASDGVLFRRAYTTSPLCSPARMALLSGRYPHDNGMVANHQQRPGPDRMHYPSGVTNLAGHLGALGYVSAYSGKWHLGSGAARPGFDAVLGAGSDYDVDTPEQNDILRLTDRLGIAIGGKQSGYDVDRARHDRATDVGPQLLPLAHHPSYLFMDRATAWVRQRANEPEPFLLVYSCREPHPPFGAPDPFHGRCRPEEMPLSPTRRDPAGAEWAAKRSNPFLRRNVSTLTDEQLQVVRAGYWDAVSYVDHLVGRLMTALLDTDQWENTLFIFTSDHGEMLGHHGLFGQDAVLYDDVIRIPLIARPPGGLGRLHHSDRLVSHVDLVPTTVRWCGGEPPAAAQGTDAGDLLRGGSAPVHDGVVAAYHSANWTDPITPMRAWVTDRWKYVATLDGTDELYDLAADPLETTNVVAHPAHRDTLTTMQRSLQAWQRETGDTWPDVVRPSPQDQALRQQEAAKPERRQRPSPRERGDL